jgi:putative phage-type endonuclease
MNIAVAPPLTRISITPDNEAHWLSLRTQDLTSTDVAALFGLSPYKTPFELWHEKKAAEVVRIADNDRMWWGRRLESAVAQGIADKQGWAVRPFKEYMRIPEARLGASFDFRIIAPISHAPQSDGSGLGVYDGDTSDDAILEIKCVDFLAFRDGWTIEDDFIEAPPHIELQVQHQMLVSGLSRAYIGVLVGGNRIEVIERQADPQVHAGILAAARQFWADLAAGIAPPPVMPDDAGAVIAMNQYAAPGKLLDARSDPSVIAAVAEYAAASARAKEADEAKQVAKADLLLAIGDAEKVLVDGYSVSAGLVGPAEIAAFTRKGFRNLRVTKKVAK